MGGLPRGATALGYALTTAADVALSGGVTSQHLTLWTMGLHAAYFATAAADPPRGIRALQGASFVGAHALLASYLWMISQSPDMETKLLRDHMPRLASWMRWPRSFILHGMPVVLAWADLLSNGSSIRAAHMAKGGGPGQQAWAMLSFFALTTAYEALVPEPGGSQYDVKMPQKKFVAITKAVAGVTAAAAFFGGLRPRAFGAKARSA